MVEPNCHWNWYCGVASGKANAKFGCINGNTVREGAPILSFLLLPCYSDCLSVFSSEDSSSAQVMGLISSYVLMNMWILHLPYPFSLLHSQLFSSLLAQISSTDIFSNTSHIKTTTHLTLYPLQLRHRFSVFKETFPERLVHTCSLFLPFSLEQAPIRFLSLATLHLHIAWVNLQSSSLAD